MSKLLNLFSNRSIASKLAAMTIVGAICMALVATSVLLVGRNQLIVERTQKAQAIVDSVWQIADGFQKGRYRGSDDGSGSEGALSGCGQPGLV
jgi:methyl-accepting chemotaxis protein